MSEFAVDVFHLEHLVVRHFGLRQQHVHVAWHPSGYRVDRVFHADAFVHQLLRQFVYRMLGTRHGQAVTGDDHHALRIGQDVSGVICASAFDRALLLRSGDRSPRLCTKATQDHTKERAVHRLTHDVAQNRARAAHQRAGNDQHAVIQREPNARRRPARVAVEHRHDHRHIRATNRDDDQHAHHKGQEQHG